MNCPLADHDACRESLQPSLRDGTSHVPSPPGLERPGYIHNVATRRLTGFAQKVQTPEVHLRNRLVDTPRAPKLSVTCRSKS